MNDNIKAFGIRSRKINMATIDVEDENILTSLFKDSFHESWTDNPEFVQYLSELSSYGIDKLSNEPDRLAEEKRQVLQSTQQLAFQHYKTFIQTAECSREIFEDFQIIEQHVGSTLEKLPPFIKECEGVLHKAEEINSSRRMNNLTLQRHTQLLEILEVPQLMDTCVRNGYYEEALELAAHVKRLEKKHTSIPVIMNIVEEVKGSAQLMLNQLIQQLRTNVQLPACLRVIGYLRRMDVFTEAELRIKFLQARDAWFQGILEAVPKDDAYTHITKTVEASRVHLFDIITQYRAIFSDEDPILSTGREENLNESALFHGWVVQKVTQFLETLEWDLQRGVGGRLDSILGQCMYFGLSFSRVGADFRGLLGPIFQRAALQGLQHALTQANKRFEENMQTYNLMNVASTIGNLSYSTSSQSGQMYPPSILLDYFPLAAYCNEVLTAFNELRLCVPISLAYDVTNSLQESLLQLNRSILSFHRAEESTFDQRERDQFQQFCQVYATDLLPYFNRCLQELFPPSQLAIVLGISVAEVSKMGSLAQLDIVAVLDSISQFLPQKETKSSPSDSQPILSPTNSQQPSNKQSVEPVLGDKVKERSSITQATTVTDSESHSNKEEQLTNDNSQQDSSHGNKLREITPDVFRSQDASESESDSKQVTELASIVDKESLLIDTKNEPEAPHEVSEGQILGQGQGQTESQGQSEVQEEHSKVIFTTGNELDSDIDLDNVDLDAMDIREGHRENIPDFSDTNGDSSVKDHKKD